MMGAVSYRLQAEFRARWKGWLGLALMVGVAGGAVTAVAAGARRTETAHERFWEGQRAPDLLTPLDCVADEEQAAQCEQVQADPAVVRSTVVRDYNALVTTAGGRNVEANPNDNCYSGPGDVSVIADPENQWGRTINRHRMIEGRAADPTRADEAVISESIADRVGIGPGDTLVLTFPNPDPVCGADLARFEVQSREVQVVGVQRSPLELEPASGFYFATVALTPAFADATSPDDVPTSSLLPVVLRDDVTAEEFAAGFAIPPEAVEALATQQFADAVENGHRPFAGALAASALVGLFAVAAVLMPAIARRMRLDAVEQPALWALGSSRGALRLAVLVRALGLAAMAAAVCLAVAVALSPIFPIGDARLAEPDPGFDLAARFLALGAALTAAVVLGAALPSIARVRTAVPAPRLRSSLLAGRLGALPLSAWCGTRLAFARASVAGSGIAAVTISVGAFVAAVTFSGGVQHLLSTPRLLGFDWHLGLLLPEGPDLGEDRTPAEVLQAKGERDAAADALSARVAEHPAVDGHAVGTIWSSVQGGRVEVGDEHVSTTAFGFDARGVEPSVISGHAPTAPDEVVLGPKALAATGLGVGDEVEVHGYEGYWESDPEPTSARYRIVGSAALISLDSKGLGYGALFTMQGVERLNKFAQPDVLWLRVAPGAKLDDLTPLLDGRSPDEALWAMTEEASQGVAEVVPAAGPDDLDIGRVDAAPLVVAGLLAVLGFGVLLQLLVSATARNRRELAVFGALGASRAQTRGAVRWQAIAFLVVPAVLGIPLGVALGRIVFHEYASRLGVVPEPVTPWLAVAITVPVLVGLALIAAAGPAYRAARLRLAEVLRSE